MIAAVARRIGRGLTLEAYSPGDWRGTRYRVAINAAEGGGLETGTFGSAWYNAAEIDAFLSGAAGALFAAEAIEGA
jgi:hypothetical protein